VNTRGPGSNFGSSGSSGSSGSKRSKGSAPPVGRDFSRAKEAPSGAADHEARKRAGSEQKKRDQAAKRRQGAISDLEARIAQREQAMRDIEAAMSAPGFYENRDQAQPVIDRHQALMWELGDLMHQWEDLQKSEI
jgi:ATP-binding cassette subfamily F protein 3